MVDVINVFGSNGRGGKPEDPDAIARQRLVEQMHVLIQGQEGAAYFPTVLKQALSRKIWKHARSWHGTPYDPMELEDFIKAPYPQGLATSIDVIKKLCHGDPAALKAFDEATTKKPGGNKNPDGIGGKSGKKPDSIVIDNNIHNDKEPRESPTGTTAQAGLRRLRKAAATGDAKAADLLRQVLEHSMTIHAACVAMGWRKPTITLVDTPERVSRAAVTKSGALGLVQYVWQGATSPERAQIAEWISEQASRRKGA